jgi:branched-chain amino acid transport system permease protein
VGAVQVVDAGQVTAPVRTPVRERLGNPVKLVASLLVFAFALVLPGLIDSYWLLVMTSVVIYSIVTLGLGLLIGRVGMVSLCQFLLVAIGAWVALRFHYATSIPFPILLLLAGLITGVIGTLIGLPALRLSGLYLALITLMAAGAITILLKIAQFPNGGDGFFGNSRGGGATSVLTRPAIAQGDTAFYRYSVVVAGLMFLLAVWHVRNKPGRAWAAIRQSEATAVAAGVNTVVYKLWAFALASFMAGIAGGLLAASAGGVNINQFPVDNSITLLAVVFMGGVYNLFGAVVAALLLRLLPRLLENWWGWSGGILTILFGIGVLQVLMTAPGGIVEQLPRDMGRLGRKIAGVFTGRRKGQAQEPSA